jgi:hypothetical protein
VQSHHIQRGLRGLQAHHFAVTRKTQRSFPHATRTRQPDMHRPDWLLFASAAVLSLQMGGLTISSTRGEFANLS